MERIIAGRSQSKDGADAVAVLIAQYVDTADICIFHNNPSDQHGTLGVRRESVTGASAKPQKGKVMEYSRSLITVLVRPQLEAQARKCYAEFRRKYERLLCKYRQIDWDPRVRGSFDTDVRHVS